MQSKKLLKLVLVFTLVLSISLLNPVIAADSDERVRLVLEYNDIEKRVSEENLQLKAGKLSLRKMENKLDDAKEDIKKAQDALYGLLYGINGAIREMDEIIVKSYGVPSTDPSSEPSPSVDPDVAAIARAARLSLSLTQSNLHSQIESLEDSTDGSSDQISSAKLNLEQAERTLINTTQNMFVLYHQLGYNLKKMENTMVLLNEQITTANLNLELGLITKTVLVDLETSLLELGASYRALANQRNSLILQMKGILGLSYKDVLTLGQMPSCDLSFVDSISLNKDIETAIENAMSIKIKKKELDISSTYGNTRKYELQAKENEVALNLTKKYYTLVETRDNLKVTESKLNSANLKLSQGRLNYDKGLISRTELSTLEREVRTLELDIQSGLATLFIETENYKAMLDGMI